MLHRRTVSTEFHDMNHEVTYFYAAVGEPSPRSHPRQRHSPPIVQPISPLRF